MNVTEVDIMQADAAPVYDPQYLAALQDAWWADHGAAIWARRQPHLNPRDPERRLKVGYVGGDFKFHSASMAFAPFVLNSTEGIENICYSTTPAAEWDETTAGFKKALGARFIDVSTYSAAALARIVRQDKIDILIDVAGLTPHHRFETFAAHPAPIQVQGWGYVMDQGWPCFTGIFADRFVAPPAQRGAMRARIIDLPCILTNALRQDVSRIRPPHTGTVFGVFQRATKFTPDACRVWSRILSAVPDATLLIGASQEIPEFRAQTLALFTEDVRGRIRFENPMSHKRHMERHGEVDLMLDTWPQTGGCSSLESLWMGVPVVTLMGERIMQRTTASILRLLGLDDFIAQTEDEYVAIAGARVQERARLTQLKQELSTRLLQSPIVRGYGLAVEAAYRSLWREYCATSQKEQVA